MDYIFGKQYVGFFESEYADIVGGNEAIAAWIADNMKLEEGFYIYKGDPTDEDYQMGLLNFFEDMGIDGDVHYFIYLKSTWKLAGF